MDSPVKEKTKLNSFNLISAICLFACIILLAVNLFLPLIFQNFGLPNGIAPLNVILFCLHALLLIFAAITLLAKPMEKLFSLSAFLLGAMHIWAVIYNKGHMNNDDYIRIFIHLSPLYFCTKYVICCNTSQLVKPSNAC